MGESLKPFHIHLEDSSPNGKFRIVFENSTFLENFCTRHWPNCKIQTISSGNPVKVSFMLDPMDTEEEENNIIQNFKFRLKAIGIDLHINIKTGILTFEFPNNEFIFILLLAIFQSLNGK